MADWVIKRGADLVPVAWRNGLGTTRDLVSVPGPDGGLRWQVSIAELVQDAAFSHYAECDRVFTPIAGEPPPELAFEGGAFEPCPLLVPRFFPGDVPTVSRILAPGRAFNVVYDRRYHEAAVTVLRLGAGDEIALPEAQHLVLYCHSGSVSLGAGRLGAGDGAVGRGWAVPVAAEAGVAILVAVRVA